MSHKIGIFQVTGNIIILNQLKIHITPKAETLLKFPNIASVEFSFPKTIKTILYNHYTKLGNGVKEAFSRLYISDNFQASGEALIGKLIIRLDGGGSEVKRTNPQLSN